MPCLLCFDIAQNLAAHSPTAHTPTDSTLLDSDSRSSRQRSHPAAAKGPSISTIGFAYVTLHTHSMRDDYALLMVLYSERSMLSACQVVLGCIKVVALVNCTSHQHPEPRVNPLYGATKNSSRGVFVICV